MNVIENLTTYKLAQFVKVPQLPCIIDTVEYPITTSEPSSNYHSTRVDNLLMHVIQTNNFRATNYKDNIIRANAHSTDDLIIVIDIMNNPQQWNTDRFPKCNLKIIRSMDFIKLSNVTKYLKELHTQLLDGNLANFLQLTPETIIKGIIIDNISYCSYDNNSLQFSELLTQARYLQNCLGCWFLTISFGMEFYRYKNNGKIGNLKYPTLLPHSYLQQIRYIFLQERDGHLRNLSQ